MSFPRLVATQMNAPWHRQGMYMGGMHWRWWIFWVLTIALLLWGFWRVFADRRETHRQTERAEAAEEALRKRFSGGEIDEDEFVQRMRTLRDTVL